MRTQRGAVDDAMAAARRYFANNLRDLRRQLGIDVLLGHARYADLVSSTRRRDQGAVELEVYAPQSYREGYYRRVVEGMLPVEVSTDTAMEQRTATEPSAAGDSDSESDSDVRPELTLGPREEAKTKEGTTVDTLDGALDDVVQYLGKLLNVKQ